jgi:hypothetical protein
MSNKPNFANRDENYLYSRRRFHRHTTWIATDYIISLISLLSIVFILAGSNAMNFVLSAALLSLQFFLIGDTNYRIYQIDDMMVRFGALPTGSEGVNGGRSSTYEENSTMAHSRVVRQSNDTLARPKLSNAQENPANDTDWWDEDIVSMGVPPPGHPYYGVGHRNSGDKAQDGALNDKQRLNRLFQATIERLERRSRTGKS